jgi:hypothetical protein
MTDKLLTKEERSVIELADSKCEAGEDGSFAEKDLHEIVTALVGAIRDRRALLNDIRVRETPCIWRHWANNARSGWIPTCPDSMGVTGVSRIGMRFCAYCSHPIKEQGSP